VPMLFLQGTRDSLAKLELVQQVVGELPLASLHVVDTADHGFAVLKKSGKTADQVMSEMVSRILEFGLSVLA